MGPFGLDLRFLELKRLLMLICIVHSVQIAKYTELDVSYQNVSFDSQDAGSFCFVRVDSFCRKYRSPTIVNFS